MKVKWVDVRYVDEIGREVGLTFSYGSIERLNDIKNRYRLSKSNVLSYKEYE